MTLLTDVRAALAVVLLTVPGIGQVHDYFRLAAHEQAVRDLFEQAGILHVWFLTLADDEPFTETRRMAGCSRARVRLAVHGYYALKDADASEKAFDDVLQAVLTRLRVEKSLGLASVVEAGPPQVREHALRTFCNVLCHYTRLDFEVWAQLEG